MPDEPTNQEMDRLRGGGGGAMEQDEDRERTDALVGKLLLLAPMRSEQWEVTIDGKSQDADVLITYALEVTGDGEWIDHGPVPVFWTYVQRQLQEQSTDETPWIVGRLEKGRRAYRIRPGTPEETEAALRTLKRWQQGPPPGAGGDGEEPF